MTETEEIVEVAYTGDTMLDAILAEPLVTQARLLIVECTYLEGEGGRERGDDRGDEGKREKEALRRTGPPYSSAI